jgi:hypothetical protein
MQNLRRANANSTSGFLGVSFCKRTGQWQAAIGLDNKRLHLGRHPTAALAGAAYMEAKLRLHPGSTI